MPLRTQYRLWCQKCQDWELFEKRHPNPDELFCNSCEEVHVKTLIKDIPEEKLLEQRQRYNRKKKQQYSKYMNEMLMDPESRQIREMVDMFREPGWDTEIVESDAGQKQLDEIAREKRAKEIEEKEAAKNAFKQEALKYKGLTRNDKCACDSGLKYKKCCMDRIESSLRAYHLRF